MRCFALVLVPAAVISVVGAARAPNLTPVGANVEGIADYDWTTPWVDVTKQSRRWGTAEGPWDGNCTVGADGWPAQSSFGNVWVSYGSPGLYTPSIEGTWLMYFTGNGTLGVPYNLLPNAHVENQVYDPATDSTSLSLVVGPQTPSDENCIYFGITNAYTKEGPGLKNIKILQPGYTLAQADDFSTPFLQLMSRFDVLRFMDWARTNDNPIVNWTDRAQPTEHSWQLKGASWEVMANLSNLLHIDMHINVPAHSNDDYILQLARLLFAVHDPALHIYIEYSNEVWNWSFEQAQYNWHAANASVWEDGDPYHFNATGLDGDWRNYRHVYMLKHIGDIFKTVFGAGNVGKDARVRPVYAWQCGGGHESGFKYLDLIWGPPASFLHSMAAAPYFTPGEVANSPTLTPDEVVAGWTSNVANISLAGPYGAGGPNYLAPMAASAAYWGVHFQGYEGGPDTAEGIDSGAPLWAKANASIDARLGPLIAEYLHAWAAYGPQMSALNYYSVGAGTLESQYGIYPVLQDMSKLAAGSAKLDGIDAARASASPVSPLIPTVPGSINASFFMGHPWPPSPDGFFGWPGTVDYLVQTPTSFRATVTVTTGTDDAGNQTLLVALGGATQTAVNVSCPRSGNWATYLPCAPAAFSLPAGVSTLRITRGRSWLGTVEVAAA